MTDADNPSQPEQRLQRPPPRSSSPAKRPHSDLDSSAHPDSEPAAATIRNPHSSQSHRSARASSVDMVDVPTYSGSSETDLSNAASSTTSVDALTQVPLPSLEEQVRTVIELVHAPLCDRQEGYAISERWLERVWSRTPEGSARPQEFNKDATQGPIGPVDNSNLVDLEALHDELTDQRGEDFVPLSKNVQLGHDYEMLPAKAWELIVGWYGLKDGSPVIRRYAYNTVPDKSRENIEYELHPPIFTIRKLRKVPTTAAENEERAGLLVASRYESFLDFVGTAKQAAGIDANNKVRIWRLLPSTASDTMPAQPSGMLTPDASPRQSSPVAPATARREPLIMDPTDFNRLTYGVERELVTGKDERLNEESNETLTLAAAGLTLDHAIILEEQDQMGEYVSDTPKSATQDTAGSQMPKGLQSQPPSERATPTGGSLTRGRTRSGKVRGHVGLSNLGNTCYMNSALQCLRSVEELSVYFLTNKWKDEVNVNNPIGHKGAIAKVYAALLSSIYDIGAVSSFAPKNFKQMLGKANSLFSGYGQQDSQEFLSWLVDALHEDLNRIHNKPYRENPDSDDNTFRDPEAIKSLGEIYRSNHQARNDSVAMDLFSGFYKNTMVCPDCNKVSITFDPYSQLTLQLPIEQTWTHTVTYVPLRGNPYLIEVDIDKNATIKKLKEYVGKRGGGIKANRIMASEVYSHKFYRHLDDKASIAESNIGARDDIYFYELDNVPSNWPAPKKKGSKFKVSLLSHGSSDEDIPDSASPLHDKVLIPVFHRGPSVSSYRGQNHAMVLWPFHIVLSREESKDFDAILQKVLAKVSQMTTRPILDELSGQSMQHSNPGSDLVVTTEADVSPSGDSLIKDGSIEDGDMVEVIMTDPAVKGDEKIANENDDLPGVLRPGAFIHPEFRQLFELKHTRKDSEIVTTGWSTVDHSRHLEPITRRIVVPPSRGVSVDSTSVCSDSSSSDEDRDAQKIPAADVDTAIAAANVSSDEDMEPAQQELFTSARSGRQNGKKSKKARRKERKNKGRKPPTHNRGKVPQHSSYDMEDDDTTDGRLIRMGEALVLEWNPEAYDALFGGTSSSEARGMDVMKLVETYDDPEIQEKKAKRAARRKHGITLEECFTESSKSEVLSEDNAWYCSRCKELRRATKTLEVWTVPDILIIHLKRFSGNRSLRDKIEEMIDFPVEGLNLAGKVGFPEGKSLTYDLFAVDNHYGGLGGGHYTATAQNFFDKQWYDYNDSIVTNCHSGEKAVTRAAYLLFYRRRSKGPLGPPSLHQIISSPSSEDDGSEEEGRARSPAGNGLRLGGLSHNGSSSVGVAQAKAGALRGGGSLPLVAENPAKSAVAAENLTDDEMHAFYNDGDEGFVDADDPPYSGSSIGGLYSGQTHDRPEWSFSNLDNSAQRENAFDETASDAPNPGSSGVDDLSSRMLEDFGDDVAPRPGVSTPTDSIPPVLGGEAGDGDVHEIRFRTDG